MKTQTTSQTEYMLWDDIRKKYPDRFVLLENPIYETEYPSPYIHKAIFRYKHRSPNKVAKKAAELKLPYGTTLYTGGPLTEKEHLFIL